MHNGQSTGLTHLDRRGQAIMVDIADKAPSRREARAHARVICSDLARELLASGQVAKGDALAVARVAGIAAAKRTPDLIPLCHPIAISRVALDVELTAHGVDIDATVRTHDRTGVEMEALTAASVAALTVIDMIKAVDRGARIESVQVMAKSGGRSGRWQRSAVDGPMQAVVDARAHSGAPGEPEATAVSDRGTGTSGGRPAAVGDRDPAPTDGSEAAGAGQPDAADEPNPARGRATTVHAAVITISDRCSAGAAEDLSGPALVAALATLGMPAASQVVPDSVEQIQAAIRAAIEAGNRLVLTTGGTGLSPRDVTAQATLPLLTTRLAGLESGLRRHGEQYTPLAALSQGVCGLIQDRVVINLPGSLAAARQCAEYLSALLPHLLDQVAGGDHERMATS